MKSLLVLEELVAKAGVELHSLPLASSNCMSSWSTTPAFWTASSHAHHCHPLVFVPTELPLHTFSDCLWASSTLAWLPRGKAAPRPRCVAWLWCNVQPKAPLPGVRAHIDMLFASVSCVGDQPLHFIRVFRAMTWQLRPVRQWLCCCHGRLAAHT